MITARAIDAPQLVHPFATRPITHAFHDIDGTHSLIRDWPPVMSAVLHDVIQNGLPEDFDSPENERRLIGRTGAAALPETDRFCVESAGLSALTQMEWAIRRAIEEGSVAVACDRRLNAEKVRGIWRGQELFDGRDDAPALKALLAEMTPRLFKLYERVLNGYCRDRNLALARKDPRRFLVPGSREFLAYLHDNGVKNYFVTGAVVARGMGMFEEVQALGFAIGKGEVIEDIVGSTWTEKLPKEQIMRGLLAQAGIRGENVLIVGDGRAEIQAGVQMGGVTISRLPAASARQRELHKALGTSILVEDFCDPVLRMFLSPGH